MSEPRTLTVILKEEIWRYPLHREWCATLEHADGPKGVFPGRGKTIPEALRNLATNLERQAHTITNEAIYQYTQNPGQPLKVVPLEPPSEELLEKVAETFKEKEEEEKK